MNRLYSYKQEECEKMLFEYCQTFLNVKFLDNLILSYNVIKGFVDSCIDQYNMHHSTSPLDTQYFDKQAVIRRLYERRNNDIMITIMKQLKDANNEM